MQVSKSAYQLVIVQELHRIQKKVQAFECNCHKKGQKRNETMTFHAEGIIKAAA